MAAVRLMPVISQRADARIIIPELFGEEIAREGAEDGSFDCSHGSLGPGTVMTPPRPKPSRLRIVCSSSPDFWHPCVGQ